MAKPPDIPAGGFLVPGEENVSLTGGQVAVAIIQTFPCFFNPSTSKPSRTSRLTSAENDWHPRWVAVNQISSGRSSSNFMVTILDITTLQSVDNLWTLHLEKFKINPMTGGYMKIPERPGDFAIKTDGHTIATISQHASGSWFMYDSQGYPVAQSRNWHRIIAHAKQFMEEG